MPVIPALRRLKQEDLEFKATLSYKVRPILLERVKKQNKIKKKNKTIFPKTRPKFEVLSSSLRIIFIGVSF